MLTKPHLFDLQYTRISPWYQTAVAFSDGNPASGSRVYFFENVLDSISYIFQSSLKAQKSVDLLVNHIDLTIRKSYGNLKLCINILNSGT